MTENPYSCSQCNKTFIVGNKSNTVEYTVGSEKVVLKKVNWFDRPYSCVDCDKDILYLSIEVIQYSNVGFKG